MPNLKFALRTLFKTPFVTVVAIVSLALGIGANAAIFSLFDQMLLRPLPVSLVFVSWQAPSGPDPAIVTQDIIVNGQTVTVIGVAPRGFPGTTLGSNPDLFLPMTLRGLMQPGYVRANNNGFENRRSYF